MSPVLRVHRHQAAGIGMVLRHHLRQLLLGDELNPGIDGQLNVAGRAAARCRICDANPRL